jgi:hypothetical protein
MCRLSSGILYVMALVAGNAVWAQTIVASPSAAQRCLTRGEILPGTPKYPQEAYDRREGGRVLVDLEFEQPNAPPSVKIVEESGDSSFVAAVREFIDAYRVPCLEPGQRSQLRQEFVFKPSDGRRVLASVPIDADERRRRTMVGCVAHERPAERISYPMAAINRGESGTVVLSLEFIDANSAPRITVLDRAGSSILSSAAQRHAEGFRMPCHEGTPVDLLWLYAFSFSDETRTVLPREVSLTTFLRSIKGIQNANVYFDFKMLGCPFDVRLKLYRPYGNNVVGELGERNEERRFFIDWLRRQELDLDTQTLNRVLGQSLTVSVPCTVLSLGTTAGGGASQ